MTAQPINEEDPRDPQVILRDLPEREHDTFLHAYQEAANAAAQDPAGYKRLRDTLQRWAIRAHTLRIELARNPRYYEDVDAETQAIKDGAVKTTPIEDVFPDWPERVAAARTRRAG